MMIVQGQAYESSFNVINLLFMNLYGPKDNFNLKQSCHSAIIKNLFCKRRGKKFIELFGTGNQREFHRR